jgi:hypothetical protein
MLNNIKKCVGLSLLCASVTATAIAETHTLNRDEMALFKLIANSPKQARAATILDPILCKVARSRCADMSNRNYISHTTPDGTAANYLVTQAGYTLPSYYDSTNAGNNIESLGVDLGNSQQIFRRWMKSIYHKSHILAESPFYQEQTSIGVGVFKSPKPPHIKYYIVLSAPPTTNQDPPLIILKNPAGKIISKTR